MEDTRSVFYFQWHITHECNLRCVHCYQEDYASHMPSGRFPAVLDDFEELLRRRDRRGQINLTGGEPLRHPDFFPLCEEIRRRGHTLAVLTNGTLIDDETAARLAGLRPLFVQISLDGPEEIHDSIRGKGAFRAALAGHDRLKARGVKTLVSFTAQKANFASFGELAKICRKHRTDKLWFDRVVAPNGENSPNLSTEEFRSLVEEANRLRKKYRRRDGGSFVSVSRSLQAADPHCDGGYLCGAGRDLLVLTADGSVMPCRRLPYVIGNAFETPMADLYEQSELMHSLAEPRWPKGCEGCSRFFQCRGGARCVTLAQTGECGAKDVNCFYC